MSSTRLVPLVDLNLRAKVDENGLIRGFINQNGTSVMLAITDDNGQIGTPDGTVTRLISYTSPLNSVLPEITGDGIYSGEHTASTGTWSEDPESDNVYTYQWLLDDVAIDGATDDAYTPLVGQIGSDLTVTVTATNAGGAESATSEPTTVLDKVPVNSVIPAITGSGAWGVELSADTGTWTAGSANVYTYQWNLDDAPIGGATASTYTPLEAQLAAVITVTVTATTTGGTDDATSTGKTVIAP